MTNLAAVFLAHVPEALRARFASAPDLEVALAGIVETGQRAWPEIRVEAGDLLAFLGPCLPTEAASELRSLRAGDLHLVCAYASGIPGASQAMEEHYLPRVKAALRRIGVEASLIADIQQNLRKRLAEMRAPRLDRRAYAGRGDLAAWLCVTAVREAGRRRERRTKEQPLRALSAELASPDKDPELMCLCRAYTQEFQKAFEEALASLSDRERTLIDLHFSKGLSIDRIGDLYGVHRATAARWINRAREALYLRTRELFDQRVSLSQEDFGRIFSLIGSQLSVPSVLSTA